MPNVLIIHLQRIIFDFNICDNRKLNTRFEFDKKLNLKEYSMKENINLKEGEILDDPEMQKYMEYDDEDFIYRLVGVVIHRGGAGRGHYWSYIRTKRGAQEPDKREEEEDFFNSVRDWKEFNDETVKFYLGKDLEKDSYGGELT